MADYRWLPEHDAILASLSARMKRSREDAGAYNLPEGGRFDDGPTSDHLRSALAYGPPGLASSGLGLGLGGVGAGSAGLVPGMGMSGSWLPSMGIGAAGSGGMGTGIGVAGIGGLGTGIGAGVGLGSGIGAGVGLGSGMGLFGVGSAGLGTSLLGSQVPPIGLDNGLNLKVARQEAPLVQGSHLLTPSAAATLFVEGLPPNCTLREASHVFRPFIGFKEVRLVPKEAKRPGGDKLLFCFVDFVDSKCAAVALEALQGYKFDENDEGSSVLKLEYAKFRGPRAPRENYHGGRGLDDRP